MIALGEQHEVQSLAVQDATNTVSVALAEAGMERGGAQALAVLEAKLREDARIAAYQDTFVMLGMLTLLALPAALLVRYRRSTEGTEASLR
jgi:hypothetical protein